VVARVTIRGGQALRQARIATEPGENIGVCRLYLGRVVPSPAGVGGEEYCFCLPWLVADCRVRLSSSCLLELRPDARIASSRSRLVPEVPQDSGGG
jgi:hypothetical protein